MLSRLGYLLVNFSIRNDALLESDDWTASGGCDSKVHLHSATWLLCLSPVNSPSQAGSNRLFPWRNASAFCLLLKIVRLDGDGLDWLYRLMQGGDGLATFTIKDTPCLPQTHPFASCQRTPCFSHLSPCPCPIPISTQSWHRKG